MEDKLARSVKLEEWLWNALYHWGAQEDRTPGAMARKLIKEAAAHQLKIHVKDLEEKLRKMPPFPKKQRKPRVRDADTKRVHH
jgi:hypothetical protein